MLKLSHLTPFAEGSTRRCFVHPHDPTKCVKVLKPDLPIPKYRFKKKNLRKKIVLFYERYVHSPSKYKYGLVRISREFLEHQRLTRFGEEDVCRHVPRHFGLIETDMGHASVVEMVRNYDGTVAPTLRDKIRNGELPEKALAEFRSLLHRLMLPYWTDPSLGNVVCARIDAGGRERLFIVDGLECHKRQLKRGGHLLAAHLKRRAIRQQQRAIRIYGAFEKNLAAEMEEVGSLPAGTARAP